MPIVVTILIPIIVAAAVAVLPTSVLSQWSRPYLLPATGLLHLIAVLWLCAAGTDSTAGGWLMADPLGQVFLLAVSVVYLCCSLYAPGYLHLRMDRRNQAFCACYLLLLGTMSIVMTAHHLGLMWVALEATTIAGAPLIYFNRTPLSLEAAWKYLLIGSVGIALALLGTFLLAYATIADTAATEQLATTLLFDDLIAIAPTLSKPWLHAAFVTLLVGYGTKMGLAPMHTWKPDAYGEAPGMVGAILAGGVTSAAFLAIIRFTMIMRAAGEFAFASRLLIGIGLLSMTVAAIFLVRQRDYKRMLAYSSVEHMGILVVGLGTGGVGIFGSLLHLINNALTKCILFIASGNIHRAYGSKFTQDVKGALTRVPISAAMFLAGFIAITGSPPFAPFISEFTILQAIFENRDYGTACLFLSMLMLIFVGMGSTVLTMVQGPPPKDDAVFKYRDTLATVFPLFILLALVLLLGVYLPPPLEQMLRAAAAFVEIRP